MLSPEEKEAKRETKKARRKFRHEISRRMRRIAIRRVGTFATGPQLDHATKILTDRYMHKVDHAPLEETALDPVVIPPRAAETQNV
jgi:hypothetical protein